LGGNVECPPSQKAPVREAHSRRPPAPGHAPRASRPRSGCGSLPHTAGRCRATRRRTATHVARARSSDQRRVTCLRFSSRSIHSKSGVGCTSTPGCRRGYSNASSFDSSCSGESGQATPACFARHRQNCTLERAQPTLRAISRSLKPSACSRSTCRYGQPRLRHPRIPLA